MIDVIIPTFNRAHLLPRAITSVLNQSYQDFFLYIVDDGSTDDTETQLCSFLKHSKVKYLKQENKGVSAARNLGIKSSTSPWIAFLDSDDQWHPHKLETQMDLISRSDLRFIHSNETWIRRGEKVIPGKSFDKSSQKIFERSLEKCLISPSTVMVKRDLLLEVGLFNEEILICEDYDLWLKILSQEGPGFIQESLVNKFGGHDDQLSMMDPAMDYWRVKSLISLYLEKNLDPLKLSQVRAALEAKLPRLLKGLQKHHQEKRFSEISELLSKTPL